LEFVVTLTSLVMYAGATWDFHRYHYDPQFVKQSGLKAPFMDGQMLGALVTRLLMQWGGADAFVRKLSYRQKSIVLVGDTITIEGKIDGKENAANSARVHCVLSVTSMNAGVVAQDIAASVELMRKPVTA
jgi:acyl dehydratase